VNKLYFVGFDGRNKFRKKFARNGYFSFFLYLGRDIKDKA